jgi:hypothetical protein
VTLADFVAKYNGGPPVGGQPGQPGLKGECVALADLYSREVIGDQEAEPFPENAVDIFGKRSAPGGFKWVRNDPANAAQIPRRGALVIFGEDRNIGTGPNGHVDICLDPADTYYNGLDQNWPLGAGPRIIRHPYTASITGWGYPQNWDDNPLPVVPQRPVPPAPPVVPSPPVVNRAVPAPITTPAGPFQPRTRGREPGPAPDPLPVIVPPVVPEPPVVAEAGVTTSEWKLSIAYLAQAAAVGTAALVSHAGALFGVHWAIPADLLQLVVDLEFGAGGIVATYAISRGIRKLGAR